MDFPAEHHFDDCLQELEFGVVVGLVAGVFDGLRTAGFRRRYGRLLCLACGFGDADAILFRW